MSRILSCLSPVVGLLAISSSTQAAVSVDFTGGAGAPLSFRLPAVSWIITDAASFNFEGVFGIAIVGVNPAAESNIGESIFDSSGWSSTGTITFAEPDSTTFFYSNNEFLGPFGGGPIWYGIISSQTAVDGDVITFAGGTFHGTGNAPETFVDGNYEVYLTGGGIGIVSTAAFVVPEPSVSLVSAVGLAGLLVRRGRRPSF